MIIIVHYTIIRTTLPHFTWKQKKMKLSISLIVLFAIFSGSFGATLRPKHRSLQKSSLRTPNKTNKSIRRHDVDESQNFDPFNRSNALVSTVYGSSIAVKRGMLTLGSIAVSSAKICRKAIKGAYDLCAIKHVALSQIYGKWKIQQDVTLRDGMSLNIPTIMDFQDDGKVIVTYNGIQYSSDYIFDERYHFIHYFIFVQ